MTCRHCMDAPDVFRDRVARWELARYRRRGPKRTTRTLLGGLRAQGVDGAVLLDVGGGVGEVQHELLAAGARHVVNVDAAPAYQDAVREEAARRGTLERIAFHAGDFVELAPQLEAADIVTLDRVLCCYPDAAALTTASAAHARHVWGAVFPRAHAPARVAFWFFNLLQRLRRKAFRVYVHEPAVIHAALEAQGFERTLAHDALLWQVQVWRRPG